MIRALIKPVLLFLVLVLGWYITWSCLVTDAVEQVKTTIAYHNQQFKTVTPHMVLKAENVSATGFPFKRRVKIDRLSWSMIDNDETYLLTTSTIEAEPMGNGEYAMHLTGQFDALYAKDKQQPEHYHLTLSEVPEFMFRAKDANPTSPMTEYKASLPAMLNVTMELNGDSKQATFEMARLAFMNYLPIPNNVEHGLYLCVAVPREALVYKTPTTN